MLWEKKPTFKDRMKRLLKPLLIIAGAALALFVLYRCYTYISSLLKVPELPEVSDVQSNPTPTPYEPSSEVPTLSPESSASANEVTETPTPTPEPEPVYTNILLVGLDSRNQTQLSRANSDTMVIARLEENSKMIRLVSVYRDTLLNIGTNETQADRLDDSGTLVGRYDKANAAYANGGIDQLITMLERNLDLKIDGYAVVNFTSLAKTIDALGGLDIWMTKEEVIHMNNYCVETSEATGMEYTPIEPDEEPHSYHLNGIQSVSYARIRYTAGNDMKRTQRQRVVIENTIAKAKEHKLRMVSSILLDLWPYTKFSFSFGEILKYASNVDDYEIEKSTGFPFTHIERHVYSNNKDLDPVVPVTLKTNVVELHRFLFDDEEYTPSKTVSVYSARIEELTGLSEEHIEEAAANSVIHDSGGEADIVK